MWRVCRGRLVVVVSCTTRLALVQCVALVDPLGPVVEQVPVSQGAGNRQGPGGGALSGDLPVLLRMRPSIEGDHGIPGTLTRSLRGPCQPSRSPPHYQFKNQFEG